MVKVGEVEVYQVGSGAKCVIWCHGCRGEGHRTVTEKGASRMEISRLPPNLTAQVFGLPLQPQQQLRSNCKDK